MSVIGIDYGNLDCVIAQAKRGGIDIVLNENSNRKNSNMVCMQGEQRLIGEAAQSVAKMHFKQCATNVKRLIGCQFAQKETQEEIANLPFKCIELSNGEVGIVLNYSGEEQTFTCQQLVAMVLSKLQMIAVAANEGVAKSDIVISVPGYFTDMQRQAMLNAVSIAGFSCLRLMNEHAAVALAYGIYKSARNLFDEKEPQHVMFIDMGHASYTVSIVAFVQGQLSVKSAVYDRQLGGRDFDLVLANHVAAEFNAKRNIDPMGIPKSRLKLLTAAEKAKKNLSPQGVHATNLNVECLVEEFDYQGKITIETFEELVQPLLARLEAPIVQALKNANLDKSQLHNIEIVGGATRVSSVKRKLAEILELDVKKPNMGLSTTLNADESVARGCALQCAMLSPLFKVKDFAISDIVSYPVRISWDQTVAAGSISTAAEEEEEDSVDTTASNSIVVLTAADHFPKTKRITFRRSEAFEIRAQYDPDTATGLLPANVDLSLGSFKISGIPADQEGTPQIRVNVKQGLHGMFDIPSVHLMQEIKEEVVEAVADASKDTDAKDEKSETTADSGDAKETETDAKTSAADTKKKADAPPAAPLKKRYRKVELTVERPVHGMSKTLISQSHEKQIAMTQQDRIIEETANKRNELESYIYDMRNQLGDTLREFISEADKAAFGTKLQDSEDWLYSEEGFDSSKSVFAAKLKELTDLGAPVELRVKECNDRPVAKTELLALVEEYKRLANTTEEAYAHWTDEDKELVRKAASEAEKWIYDELTKQEALAQTQTPVLTAAMIRQQANSLRNACKAVLTKPKPAPVVVPEPVAEDAKEGEEKKEDNSMDLD